MNTFNYQTKIKLHDTDAAGLSFFLIYLRSPMMLTKPFWRISTIQ
jgi:hypothetical protein